MPRVNVPVTQPDRDGVADPAPTTGDATNNHSLANDGQTIVRVENTGAAARIVTFRFSKTVDGQSVTSKTKSLAAGDVEWFGPYPTAEYGRLLEVDVAHAELVLSAFRVVPAG